MQRKKWALIAAMVMGLLVAGVSAYYLLQLAADYQEMTQIVVPKTKIPAYSLLTEDKLGIKTVPVGSADAAAAADISQVLGKVATSELFSGEQIRLERLTDKELVDTSRNQVAVNINLTRSVGGQITPGVLVDVYWLQGEQVPGALLAVNAVVLAVLDGEGNNLIGSKNRIIGEVQHKGLPAVVVLSVEPQYVPQLIRGSADESTGLVLVKKLKRGGGNTVAASTEAGESETKNRKEDFVRSD